MNKYHLFYFFVIITILSCIENPKGLTIQEAEKMGIFFDSLNVVYKSAVSVDTSNAVFKTEPDIEKAHIAYQNLLEEFSKFLTKKTLNGPLQRHAFKRFILVKMVK